MEASHVMQTIARNKAVILAAAVLCALLAWFASSWVGRQYTASATLRIRAAQLLTPVDRLASTRSDETSEAPTPEAQQAQTQAMVKTVEALAKSPGVLGDLTLDRRATTAELQSRIEVKELSPVIVQISASDSSVSGAAYLVNQVAERFLRYATSLRADEARSERQGLKQQLDAARKDLLRAGKPTTRDQALRAAAAEQDYTRLLRRMSDLREAEGALRQGGIGTIVSGADAANPPLDATSGHGWKLAIAGLLLGGLFEAALVVLLEAFDRRIRSVADAEALFGKPVLAVVPRAPARWTPLEVATAASAAPTSPVAEAYHFLALQVLRRIPKGGCLALAGLAARRGQGVSATLTNLAIAAAQAGQRVVLVDADLRQPSLHETFEMSIEPGLSDLPAGDVPPESLVRATAIPNLALASAGTVAANPWVVLRSPAFARFISGLRERADLLLVNTPAAGGGADALSVAAALDGALLVFRASGVPGAPETSLVETVRQAEVPIVGVVLNDARTGEIEPFRLPAGTQPSAGAIEPERDSQPTPPAFAAPREAAEWR